MHVAHVKDYSTWSVLYMEHVQNTFITMSINNCC